jgi:hypothetical protein
MAISATMWPMTTYVARGQERELWNPWTTVERVGTARHEARFVEKLSQRANTTARPWAAISEDQRRCCITSIITALRGAVTFESMMRRAPGLRPDALTAAYNDLEDRRSRSELAWRTIVDSAESSDALAAHGPTAAHLLPVVIGHLGALHLRRRDDEAALGATIRAIDEEIERTVKNVEKLEATLDGDDMTEARTRQVGELLFDRYGQGAWSLNTFLAPRVGALISVRVDSLLEGWRPPQSGMVR